MANKIISFLIILISYSAFGESCSFILAHLNRDAAASFSQSYIDKVGARAFLKGEVHFPEGLEFRLTNDGPNIHSIELDKLPPNVAKVAKRIADASRIGGKVREVAAIVVEFNDGTTEDIAFTSNQLTQVDSGVFDRYRDEMGFRKIVTNRRDEIKRIYHLHTHPDPLVVKEETGQETTIPPAPDDLRIYQEWKRAEFPSIPFVGVVVPLCSACEGMGFAVPIP